MRCSGRKHRPWVCGRRGANPASSIDTTTSGQAPELSGLGFFKCRVGMVTTSVVGRTKWVSPHSLQQCRAQGKCSVNTHCYFTPQVYLPCLFKQLYE